MNVRLLAWATLFPLIFAVTQEWNAQQPAANLPVEPPQTQPDTDLQPELSPRDMAIERAKILMVEKQYEAGIHACEEILKAEPKNAFVLNMTGIAYLNMSNILQAKKYFERSIKADKKYASAVNNLGIVSYQQKNYRRAIQEYRRAAAIDPGLAGAHVNLGYAYYRTKKYSEAALEFRKALQLDPHAFEHNERVGTLAQDRTVENHGLFFFILAREYAQLGDAKHCADYLRRSLDEGYKDVRKAKTDPAFKNVLDDPTVQNVFSLMTPADSKTATTEPGT
jgi:tetratricopeptide (TPR) repeat protein